MSDESPAQKHTAAAPTAEALAALTMQWGLLSMQISRGQGLPQLLHLLNENNLSMPMMVVLHIVAFEGKQTMTALSEKTGLSTSAMSHLIQRLVEQGLLDRQDDADDRRVRQVALTASATELVGDMTRQRFAELRASAAPLSAPARAALASALQTVVGELALFLNTSPAACPHDPPTAPSPESVTGPRASKAKKNKEST